MSDDSADALAEALGLGPAAQPILDAIHHLYASLDADIAQRAAPLALPCRAGCDACCHESVFVSAPEVLAVFAYLLEHRTREQITLLVGEMRALADRFEDELELLETIPPGDERDEVSARVKFRCPLLGENGACTIYPVRELNGRTFGQAWDAKKNSAYGCTLTHARLAVLPPDDGRGLADARWARTLLAARLPGTERVHVYPWWFARYGDALISAARR